MVSGHQRAFAVRVAARAHVAADQLEAGAVGVALGRGEHGHVQQRRRREAAARDQHQRRLVCVRQAALEPVVGERVAVVGHLGQRLGRGRRRAGGHIRGPGRRRGKGFCRDAAHGVRLIWRG